MDRTLVTFKEAADRVKISHFTKQGYYISGIVHVGANDGYEIEFYKKMGIWPIMAFEPLKAAAAIVREKHPDIYFLTCALGNFNGRAIINVTPGDGKGSSLLPEIKGPDVMPEEIRVTRWATQVESGIDRSAYNCCVIDVQGMELDVLRGMDDYIKDFDFLSVECSSRPIYRGEASADEVIAYLDKMGFQRDSDIPEHDDVMFINRRVLRAPEPEKPLPVGTRLNIGSGQRRFEGHGWINVDCVSRPGQVPDLVCDVGRDPLPYPDDSMEYVVLHQVYEHFGLGEGHRVVKEAYRVLRPGGSLLITVPDPMALAQRWMTGQIDDYIYNVNMYGAYQGEEGDRHRWSYTFRPLQKDLLDCASWRTVRRFDWRAIQGADIACAWWILGVEAVK